MTTTAISALPAGLARSIKRGEMITKCTRSNLRRNTSSECIFAAPGRSWHGSPCWPRSSSRRAAKQRLTRSFSNAAPASLRSPNEDDLTHFRSILAPHQIVTTLGNSSNSRNDLDPYNRDWTNRYQGHSSLVLRPQSTQQVSSILAHCHERRIPLVPRGGNTGLCGGSTPLSNEVVLSLEYMNVRHSLDASSGILSAQAGCILHDLHEYASQRGYLFPLEIGSKGTCQIGGNVSTNAGGQYYYRWGGLHGNVVGMEVVLPDGRVLRLNMAEGRSDVHGGMDSAASVGGCHRKDNTGYDLKHLFIGAEGTLGVITEVAVACPPLPTSKHAVMIVCESYSTVLEVLVAAKEELGEILSAMELMDWQTLTLVRGSLGDSSVSGEALLLDEMLDTKNDSTTASSPPLSQSTATTPQSPLYILVETQGSNSEHDASKMDSFLTRLYDSSTIRNGFLATDSKRIHTLWNIREACNPAVSRSGYVYKYDVSVPIEEYMDVAAEVKETLSSQGSSFFPETAVCVWGHLADGNAHINVVTPGIFTKDESLASHVDESVYGSVLRRRGSISAEHGIGQSKSEILGKIKDRSVLDVMVQLKQLFDPHGIMNPGKVLTSDMVSNMKS